jgi:hypothetical protein
LNGVGVGGVTAGYIEGVKPGTIATVTLLTING